LQKRPRRGFRRRNIEQRTGGAACAAGIGELDESIQILNEATRTGLWWDEEGLKLETDLDPVRGRPDFKSFLAECNRLKHVAGAAARPELKVLTPDDYSPRRSSGPTDRSAPEGRRLRRFYPALEACAIERCGCRSPAFFSTVRLS
jgi:hypothetical protein